MGGQANTPDANTWGLTTWNQNSWGQQGGITVSITGVSASTALGNLAAFPEQGWGRQQYGNSGWGVEYSVLTIVTGKQLKRYFTSRKKMGRG